MSNRMGVSQIESLELIVLSVLSDGPRYGYAIMKQAAVRSEGQVRLTPGALYPLLHAMEREGLVAASWEAVRSDRGRADGSSEGRRRKWYRLSAKGRRRLAQRIRSHRSAVSLIERFIAGAGAERT